MTNDRNDVLIDFAKNYAGIKHYKSRRKPLAQRMFAAFFRFLYELTIGSVLHLIKGVYVVRR